MLQGSHSKDQDRVIGGMNLYSLSRAANEHAALPLLFALIGILVALLYPRQFPGPVACFGSRSQANAQRGAERWLRNHPPTPMWPQGVIRNGRVHCHPITENEQWAECNIGPVGNGDTFFVVDCDTAETNNLGCVSGR